LFIWGERAIFRSLSPDLAAYETKKYRRERASSSKHPIVHKGEDGTRHTTKQNAVKNAIHTRTELSGAAENRPIQACVTDQLGKSNAAIRQSTNNTISAAENPHAAAITSILAEPLVLANMAFLHQFNCYVSW
jgi:hypothetical protein